jgi:uncharacterized protein with GYD domain
MGTYVLLMRNNSYGAENMLQSGAVGATFQHKAVEDYGGRLLFQGALAGRFDAIVIAEFEPEACLAFALAASAQGQYVEQIPVVAPDQVERAAELHFKAQAEMRERISEALDQTLAVEAPATGTDERDDEELQ